jgi:hypothetical protein
MTCEWFCKRGVDIHQWVAGPGVLLAAMPAMKILLKGE